MIQGILFKFALDTKVGDRYMYGQTEPDDEKGDIIIILVFQFDVVLAQKGALNERKGLITIMHCNIPGNQ